MEKTKNIKEHIMDVTTQLIQESDGDINQITIRRIAERAQVGLGLINYHFGSKDKLILECIQRIINNVVHCLHRKRRFTERMMISIVWRIGLSKCMIFCLKIELFQ